MRLALAQLGVTRPAGLDDFLDRIAGMALYARNGGAEFMVLPEYASMVLAGAFVAYPDIAAELAVVVEHANALIAGLRSIAQQSGLWMLGGSVPMRDADGMIRNRAPLISPGGDCLFQDKQFMTVGPGRMCLPRRLGRLVFPFVTTVSFRCMCGPR
jgi:predicted amidohydrolase